jgi:hypothetical protein
MVIYYLLYYISKYMYTHTHTHKHKTNVVSGLVVVFVGFGIYERENLFGPSGSEDQAVLLEQVEEHTPSYQERLILVSLPTGTPKTPKLSSSLGGNRSHADYKSISMTSTSSKV